MDFLLVTKLTSVLWAKHVSEFEVSFEHFLSVLQLLFLLIVVYHVCLVNEDSHCTDNSAVIKDFVVCNNAKIDMFKNSNS